MQAQSRISSQPSVRHCPSPCSQPLRGGEPSQQNPPPCDARPRPCRERGGPPSRPPPGLQCGHRPLSPLPLGTMNGLVFYIGLGLGLALAAGLRPFLPALLAGALASCRRAGRRPSRTATSVPARRAGGCSPCVLRSCSRTPCSCCSGSRRPSTRRPPAAPRPARRGARRPGGRHGRAAVRGDARRARRRGVAGRWSVACSRRGSLSAPPGR